VTSVSHNPVTAQHQLGEYIVLFQHAETSINELLVLLAQADDEAIRILVNELGYSQRLKTVDVLFSRFVDLRRNPDLPAKAAFHKLMVELDKLGRRRNELVHSTYMTWIDVAGDVGLFRQNSRLRGSTGIREEEAEELLPDAFNNDIERLDAALQELGQFRLEIIDWICPDENSSS
jgi:hypothetical protein